MAPQTDCQKCPFMATDWADELSPMMCIALWATKHEVKHCVSGKVLDNCPLIIIKDDTELQILREELRERETDASEEMW